MLRSLWFQMFAEFEHDTVINFYACYSFMRTSTIRPVVVVFVTVAVHVLHNVQKWKTNYYDPELGLDAPIEPGAFT